jgi:hypothetical protein
MDAAVEVGVAFRPLGGVADGNASGGGDSRRDMLARTIDSHAVNVVVDDTGSKYD